MTIFFFSKHMPGWEKVLFCADHMLVPLPGAVHTTGMAVLQMASELHLLWVTAGGSLSRPSLWSSLAPCPSLVITPSSHKNLSSSFSPSNPDPVLVLALQYVV